MLTNEELKNALKEVEKSRIEIDSLWEKCDNEEIDCDEVAELTSELEDKAFNNLSMYLIVKELDKEHKRNSNQQYDVTKIKISKDDDERYRKNDLELIRILKPDWTESKISKEIGMLYLFSGFAVDESLAIGEFKLEENFIMTNKEK